MANVKNFGLIGVGNDVQFGKGGPHLARYGTSSDVLQAAGTAAFVLPVGDDADRDAISTVTAGMIRFNTDSLAVEVYDGTTWSAGGDVVALKQEVDNIEGSLGAGVNPDGTFNVDGFADVTGILADPADYTDAINQVAAGAGTALTNAQTAQDTADDALAAANGAQATADNIQIELDKTQVSLGTGVNADGTFNAAGFNVEPFITTPPGSFTDAINIVAGAIESANSLDEIFPSDADGNIIYSAGGVWTQGAPGGASGVQPLDASLTSLSALAGPAGFLTIDATGDVVASHIISGTTDNIVVTGGNGSADVVIDLAPVTDSGIGTFLKVDVDGFGRVTGTMAVETADITALVDDTYVNVDGDTMTGLLILSGDPTDDLGAATKQYVDAVAGDTSALQTEVDAIETSLGAGVKDDGTFNAPAFTGSATGATSFTDATNKVAAAADAAGAAAAAAQADADAAQATADQAVLDAAAAQAAADAAQTAADDAQADATQALADAAAAQAAADAAQIAADDAQADATAAQAAADAAQATANTALANAATAQAAADAAQAELDVTQTSLGAGVNADGTFNAAGFVGVVPAPTSFTDAINKVAAASSATTLEQIEPVEAAGNIIYADSATTWAQALPGVTSGVQPFSDALTAFEGNTDPGLLVQTAAGEYASRSLVAPAEGFTITNPDGVAGDPTFVLANDLAAVEGLTTNGYAIRTGDGTWKTGSINGQPGNIVITNNDGVLSDTNIDLAEAGSPITDGFVRITTDAFGRVVDSTDITAADIIPMTDPLYVSLTGDIMTGSLVMNGGATVTGLPTPTDGTDAANKNYVDAAVAGLSWKQAARAGTTGNINVAVGGLLTVDGVTLVDGDRVLVKNQTVPSENGIYAAHAGAWTRTADANDGTELVSAAIFVEEGTSQGGTGWVQTTVPPITIGTSPIVFQQFTGAGTYSAGAGLTLTGNQFDVGAGAGIVVGPDNVNLGLFTPDTGALILTEDGTTRSTNAAAGLSLLLDAGSGLEQDAEGLRIPAAGVTNDMLQNNSFTINGDSGSATNVLGSTFQWIGDSVQGIRTSVTAGTPNIFQMTALDASASQKGVASFDAVYFTVTAGNVVLNAVNLGTGVTGTLGPANGGTGQTTYAEGDLLVGNATGGLDKLAVGADGTFLSSDGTTVSWVTASGTTVTSFSGGTTGLTPATATTGDVVLGGTLVVANGGTGANTLTGYVKGNGTAAMTASATIPGADITGDITGNAENVNGIVAPANGGTGIDTYTAGDLLVGNLGGGLDKLPVGTDGQVLVVTGGVPEWSDASATAVTSFMTDLEGLTPATATSGDVVLSGTLGPTSGGTGVDNGTNTITLGGNIDTGGVLTTGGDFSVSGAFSTNINVVADTNVTMPPSGTLATLDNIINTGVTTIPTGEIAFGDAEGDGITSSDTFMFDDASNTLKVGTSTFASDSATGDLTVKANPVAPATDADITLLPSGAGQVVVGPAGNGFITSDAGATLTITGDNGLFLDGGTAKITAPAGYETGLADNDLVNKKYVDTAIQSGAASGAIKAVKATLTSSGNIGAPLPAGATVLRTKVNVISGSGTFTVGKAGSVDAYMLDTENDLTAPGLYLAESYVVEAAATQVVGTFSGTGSVDVIVEYQVA